jgi:hypothetical protein
MDRPPALVIDDIVGSAVTIDGAIVLISLNAAGYLIDLAFPAAKAEELVTVLAGALEKAARNRGRYAFGHYAFIRPTTGRPRTTPR